MLRSRTRAILSASLVLLGAAGSSCASAPSLRGTPQTTGIVVVEPDITFYANTIGTPYGERLIGGTVTHADDPKHVVQGSPTSGLLVFSNLTPGTWRLSLVEGQLPSGIMLQPEQIYWRRHYEPPPEGAGSFTFEVRAGDVAYAAVGIVDDDRADSRGVRFSRHEDPAIEKQAWMRMDQLYGATDWGPVFRAKLGASAPTASR